MGFLGFQIDVSDEEKEMPTSDFRKLVKSRVDDEVSKVSYKHTAKLLIINYKGIIFIYMFYHSHRYKL